MPSNPVSFQRSMTSDPNPPDFFDEPPIPHGDLEFVRAALGGDDQAIQFLAERARIVPRVLAVLNRKWGRPLTEQDIEDLSQDVVVYVLQKLEAYHGHSPFDAWLYRFCANQMRNRVRREIFRRRVIVNEETEPEELPDLVDQLDGKAMWSYVDELEPTDRDIMRAKHVKGLSFTEIGQQLGAASSSIKTRYYRSIDRLRCLAKLEGVGRENS